MSETIIMQNLSAQELFDDHSSGGGVALKSISSMHDHMEIRFLFVFHMDDAISLVLSRASSEDFVSCANSGILNYRIKNVEISFIYSKSSINGI